MTFVFEFINNTIKNSYLQFTRLLIVLLSLLPLLHLYNQHLHLNNQHLHLNNQHLHLNNLNVHHCNNVFT